MRKLPVFTVLFWPEGILEGTVNVVAETAEDAIEIARQSVEAEGGKFELRAITPIMLRGDIDDDSRLAILWSEDTEVEPENVVTHEGKRYEAGVKLPMPEALDAENEIAQDSAEETTPKAKPTEADKIGAEEIAKGRKEFGEWVKDGKVDPWPGEKAESIVNAVDIGHFDEADKQKSENIEKARKEFLRTVEEELKK